MIDKIKNITTIALFIIITCGFMIVNIISPDNKISYSERRNLAKFPTFSFKKLYTGDLFIDFEKYSLDQFVYRDDFRGLKTFVKLNILAQKDNNGLYIVDENINKIEYPLNEKSVINAANKFNEINDKYLQNMNVKYAIIPDKNFFLASDNEYLSIDYNKLTELMDENLFDTNYINLYETLSINDYYRTDIHWSQDKLIESAAKILKEYQHNINTSDIEYTKKELYPFYGSYYGQAALKMQPDTLVYLTNEALENSIAFDHYYKTYSNIYEPEKFSGIDPYDVFLSGQKPLITIENTDSISDKGLILFRDSFGSSIAPLLLAGYSKITLIDLRLVSTNALSEFIDFSNYHDALFLYSTQTINNSFMLK